MSAEDQTRQELDRSKLTFSQAEGLEPLPEPLKLGELSQEARSLIWHEVHQQFQHYSYAGSGYGAYTSIIDPWRAILYKWHVRMLHLPADEFDPARSVVREQFKALILREPYNKVLDFLQFAMRHPKCPGNFGPHIAWALTTSRCAYEIGLEPPTIIPRATEQEGQAITRAFADLGSAGLEGSRTHLRQATERLNSGDYPGSVRESINAVESVARQLDPAASKRLEPALAALTKHAEIHPALKTGFANIYGYTSDEPGLRHPLLEGTAKADLVDAVFMLGACASFASYLVAKARKAGLIKE